MWYYIMNNKQVGPIDDSHILNLVKNGTISQSTKVWRKGMQHWRSAVETDMVKNFSSSQMPVRTAKVYPDSSTSLQNKNINDTINTLKLLLENPVGNLNKAFENLNSKQIIVVSLIIIFLTSALSIFGIKQLIPTYFQSFSYGFGEVFDPDIYTLFKLSLIIPASIFAVSVFVCSILKQRFNYVGELFVTSIYNIPIGLFLILSSIFTFKNIEIIIILSIFFIILSILILFSGCVKVLNLSERAAAYSVPVILLISTWFVTVLFRAIIL